MKRDQQANLLVLPWSPDLPGGVSVVVRNLARIWQAADIPVSILVSSWESRKLRRNENGTHSLKLAVLGKSTLFGLLKSLLLLPIILWRTLQLLKQQHIGTVYFHYANLDAFGIALLRRLGLYRGRLVLCFHGTDVRTPKNRITRAVWNFIFRSASAVTACSNALARGVEATYGLPEGCVTTVYNGVNTDIFCREAGNRSAAGDLFDAPIQRYIVSVGSFIVRKGHRSLVEAFARVSSAFPDLGLVVVGMDGDQRALLEARVAALGLQRSVRFLINLEPAQVAGIVAGATLCVQPSIAEPFGMAVIEAGACGIPVAASAVGGHTELITHGRTGFLFEAGDVEAIGSMLLQVLHDDDARAKAADAFHAKVVSGFTWQACADLYQSGGAPCCPPVQAARA